MTNPAQTITIGNVVIKRGGQFSLLAGPCAMENRDHAMMMAEELYKITSALDIGLIYKSSFDKANRSSIKSPRGIGLDAALKIFEEVRESFGIPVVTDIHTAEQCALAAQVVDVLQIPAFLCRQTDILIAAARTGKAINVKKGQFLAPWDMEHVINKVVEAGNINVMACERGTSFGYNTLVSDFRSLPIMHEVCRCPIVFDATHSVQQPGGQGVTSGGQRQYVETLASAAISIGVEALFIETHQDPDNAPSDGPNMVPLSAMPKLLTKLKRLDDLVKGFS